MPLFPLVSHAHRPIIFLEFGDFNHLSAAGSSRHCPSRGGDVAARRQARAFECFCSSLPPPLPSARRRFVRLSADYLGSRRRRPRQEGRRLPVACDDRGTPRGRQRDAMPEDRGKGNSRERWREKVGRAFISKTSNQRRKTQNADLIKNAQHLVVWPRPHLRRGPSPRRGRSGHSRGRPG